MCGIDIQKLIDMQKENWRERYEYYFELRNAIKAPRGITKNTPEKEAILKYIETYDAKLLAVYNVNQVKEKK